MAGHRELIDFAKQVRGSLPKDLPKSMADVEITPGLRKFLDDYPYGYEKIDYRLRLFDNLDKCLGEQEVAADFDGDNDLDVAVAASGTDRVKVLENTGNALNPFRLAPQAFFVGDFPVAMAVGDLNRDNRPDLVTANFNSNDLSVLVHGPQNDLNFLGAESFSAAEQFPDSHTAVAIGELNQDGSQNLDVAAAINFGTGFQPEIGILGGDGTGGFISPSSFPVGPTTFDATNSIGIGDLDGDGRNDLVINHTGLDDIGVLFGTGFGNFAPEVRVPAGGDQRALVLEDLNLDGLLDVILIDSTNPNPSVRVLFGHGGDQFVLAPEVPTGGSPSSLALADLNGDGLLDIALTDESSASVLVLLQEP